MKPVFFILLGLLSCSRAAFALEALSRAEADALCARIETALRPPQTAGYRLIRHSDLLEHELESSGTLEIPEAGVIRLHQQAPEPRETVLDAASSRFPVPERLLDPRLFRIECFDEGGNYLLVLVPLRRDLSRIVGSVELRTDACGEKLKKIRLNAPDGGFTLLEIQ
ncbi:MAG: hypothetical protein IJS62_04340 [Bacteroidales bacterium]|nr:hypothetical protein [Bacteroidales bacterium]